METKAMGRLSTAEEKKMYFRDQLVTLGDLEQFRHELLKEIKHMLAQKHVAPEKQWLKSSDVRKLLKISPGTLQHLRDSGQLSFTKLGGIIYYDQEAIKSLLERR